MIAAEETGRGGIGRDGIGGDGAGADQPPARPPRDAASLVLLRRTPDDGVAVLMGQRGEAARFMPSKMVFPGGALDPADLAAARAAAAAGAPTLEPLCAARLARALTPERAADAATLAEALALAAIRETFEEAGLRLGAPSRAAADAVADADAPDADWGGFAAAGLRPVPERLRFFFRAVTPPDRPIRFDARFFLAQAGDLACDPDDFSGADGELGRLGWTPLAEARDLPLAFITHLVLAEAAAAVDAIGLDALFEGPWERPVPFFRHEADGSEFVAL